MNYSCKYVVVRSNWFDHKNEKNKFKSIGYKGFNLYLNMYRFYIPNQESEYTFITSISLLRKETGYRTEEVFELLKLLQKEKVIKIKNVSRWNYLYDVVDDSIVSGKKIKIKDDKILVIEATDIPETGKIMNEKGQIRTEPEREEDYYVFLPLELMEMYKENDLNERYYPLYCLIRKMSNNKQCIAFMSIEKMAHTLGYDKDYTHKMIVEMNRKYFLSSDLVKGKKDNKMLEHRICRKKKDYEEFKVSLGSSCDKYVARFDKKKESKAKKKTTLD